VVPPSSGPPSAALERGRAEIDAIDRALLELLCHRFEAVERLWRAKLAEGLPLEDALQEAVLRDRTEGRARALGLDPDFAWELLQRVVEEGKLRTRERFRATPRVRGARPRLPARRAAAVAYRPPVPAGP
jgi:chorismate mutase